jgi:hypothetical protein
MPKLRKTTKNSGFDALVDLCRRTHEALRDRAVRSADVAMVDRNWLIGWYMVEYEQNGADRAVYGTRFLETLSAQLRRVGVKGSSTTRLKLYRSFYLLYKGIRPTLSDESGKRPLGVSNRIGPTVSVESPPAILQQQGFNTVSTRLIDRFSLGWSHSVEGGVEGAVGED